MDSSILFTTCSDEDPSQIEDLSMDVNEASDRSSSGTSELSSPEANASQATNMDLTESFVTASSGSNDSGCSSPGDLSIGYNETVNDGSYVVYLKRRISQVDKSTDPMTPPFKRLQSQALSRNGGRFCRHRCTTYSCGTPRVNDARRNETANDTRRNETVKDTRHNDAVSHAFRSANGNVNAIMTRHLLSAMDQSPTVSPTPSWANQAFIASPLMATTRRNFTSDGSTSMSLNPRARTRWQELIRVGNELKKKRSKEYAEYLIQRRQSKRRSTTLSDNRHCHPAVEKIIAEIEDKFEPNSASPPAPQSFFQIPNFIRSAFFK